ncbi:hypothetical protein HMPREF9370_1988 [Neisseria wadsworthii 9715]|uniref:Uncharacterized protein n=1 Tax=Neisseria wadsworthii 9715 TaxID=1030841 RepID=G4CSC8_9NEIS|nr:hypothetical protein HMPREF9370_1988 [Neisseria wadsworthii 9715]
MIVGYLSLSEYFQTGFIYMNLNLSHCIASHSCNICVVCC